MAKKINSDNPGIAENPGEDTTKAVGNAQVEKQVSEDTEANEPDDFVMQVLRLYPGYKSLYVDRYGSAYAPDTAAPLRKGAVLYDNPFYKSFKTNR